MFTIITDSLKFAKVKYSDLVNIRMFYCYRIGLQLLRGYCDGWTG